MSATMTISPVSVTATGAHSSNDKEPWRISKWNSLQEKRLRLSRQRVALERRLFESAPQFDPPLSGQQQQQQQSTETLVQDMEVALTDGATGTATGGTSADEGTGTWTGPLRDGLPHGHGRMVYANGQVYQGQVVRGQRHGRGRNTWPNGQVFTGLWENNSRCGRGTHAWPDGKTVTGQWVHGHLEGRCFFQWPDGATYDGDTVGGKKSGRGIHTWADGKVYRGQYQQGFEHGFGCLTEAGGAAKYRGHFRHGQRHGYGVQIWKEKSYDGEWAHNAVSGRGKLQWQSGARYHGEFRQGRYHGHGTYIDDDGREYVGEWRQGQKHGRGTDTWTSGQVYVGNYRDGRRSGYGRMTYPDGSLYVGEWWRNKKTGRGVLISRTGFVEHCGLWKADRPRAPPVVHVSQDDWPCAYRPCTVHANSDAPKDNDGWRAQDDIDLRVVERTRFLDSTQGSSVRRA